MSERASDWNRLDNAAKIYPAAKRRNWNNFFRISAAVLLPRLAVDLGMTAAINVLKADGEALRTLPPAVASRDMGNITTTAWRPASVLAEIKPRCCFITS